MYLVTPSTFQNDHWFKKKKNLRVALLKYVYFVLCNVLKYTTDVKPTKNIKVFGHEIEYP